MLSPPHWGQVTMRGLGEFMAATRMLMEQKNQVKSKN
jgi:hypothetical protein